LPNNKIQANFNAASRSYDGVARVQRKAAGFLVKKLLKIRNFNPKTILDLGTGTGYIPELLIQIYPESFYYLNDIAGEMLEVCKLKFTGCPKVVYLHGDMEKLNVDTFDVVISNFALQWVDNLSKVLENFYAKSSEVFAFSTLVDGTFQEWEIILNQYQDIALQKYPAAEELINYCNALKDDHLFEYWVMDAPLFFDHPLNFMRYLKLLGASASKGKMGLNALKALLNRRKKGLTVSYKILFGIFKKIGK